MFVPNGKVADCTTFKLFTQTAKAFPGKSTTISGSLLSESATGAVEGVHAVPSKGKLAPMINTLAPTIWFQTATAFPKKSSPTFGFEALVLPTISSTGSTHISPVYRELCMTSELLAQTATALPELLKAISGVILTKFTSGKVAGGNQSSNPNFNVEALITMLAVPLSGSSQTARASPLKSMTIFCLLAGRSPGEEDIIFVVSQVLSS